MTDTRPFTEIKVLSFGTALAGNDCALTLAALGADVVKIESRGHPDYTRALRWPDHPRTYEPSGVEICGFHAAVTHSKKNLSLNMGHPAARELFKRLVAKSDVVINNFSPSVMPKWGLDFDVLSGINPRLVMISMPGLGKTGPKSHWVSFNHIIEAYVGLAKLGGFSHIAHCDYVAAIHGAVAVLVGLRQRERTGRGLFVDLAQTESVASLMGELFLDVALNGRDPEPPGNWVEGSAFSGVFRCNTADSWVAIECEDEDDWRRLSDLALPAASADERFETPSSRRQSLTELTRLLESWTTLRTAHQAMLLLQKAGIAAGVVQNGEDLFRDPQLRSRDFMVEVHHQDLGTSEIPGSPLRLSRTPARVRYASHRLGQDNAEILARIGLRPDRVEELEREGVL